MTVLTRYLCRPANRRCPIKPQSPHPGDVGVKACVTGRTADQSTPLLVFRTTQYPPLEHLSSPVTKQVSDAAGVCASQSKGLSIRPHYCVKSGAQLSQSAAYAQRTPISAHSRSSTMSMMGLSDVPHSSVGGVGSPLTPPGLFLNCRLQLERVIGQVVRIS